jgi:hydrogenase-4 membrane subunit HyfE
MELSLMGIVYWSIEICAFLMLIFALFIATSRTIQQMLVYYYIQSGLLTFITMLTVLESGVHGGPGFNYWMFWIVLIPIVMAIFLEPVLVYGTLQDEVPLGKRLARLFTWFIQRRESQGLLRQVTPIWLRSQRSNRGGLVSLSIALVLMILAFGAAFNLSTNPYLPQGVQQISEEQFFMLGRVSTSVLAIAFSLLALGLSVMTSTEDIISMVVGMLVMYQGMFLAAVRITSRPAIANYFILGLTILIMSTLTILVFLLPGLHHRSGALDTNQQNQLKG